MFISENPKYIEVKKPEVAISELQRPTPMIRRNLYGAPNSNNRFGFVPAVVKDLPNFVLNKKTTKRKNNKSRPIIKYGTIEESKILESNEILGLRKNLMLILKRME